MINWLDFLRDMVRHRLRAPVQTTANGAPGPIRAVEEVFPRRLRQRCLAHKSRNVLDKVPDSTRAEVNAMIQAANYAPNQEVARMVAAQVLEASQAQVPIGDEVVPGRLGSLHRILALPGGPSQTHTDDEPPGTELPGTARRTKVIPRFVTEESCLKLVFATLWRASECWRGVKMSDFERQQLKLLRKELGLLSDRT